MTNQYYRAFDLEYSDVERVKVFTKDLAEFEAMIADPGQNLRRRFPWGTGQTLLREAMLLADHNAYHLGQLA